jgi:ABC-type Fe3+ transport system substrate-binding protein
MPGYWVSDSYTNMPLWNKTALEKGGIKNFNPTSWSDFVDPRLPPLTSLGNPASPTTNVPWGIAMRRVMGDEWFLKLAKGKAVPFDKAGQAEAWIGSGEYPICLNMRIKYAQSLEAAGVDVGWLWPKEGQVMVPFALAIFANPAHPNTAKLFVDYVRSARGADTMAGTGAMLVYARPGVKIPEKEKKYWPTGEMTVIPFDYTKELTTEAVKAYNTWAKNIGLGY